MKETKQLFCSIRNVGVTTAMFSWRNSIHLQQGGHSYHMHIEHGINLTWLEMINIKIEVLKQQTPNIFTLKSCVCVCDKRLATKIQKHRTQSCIPTLLQQVIKDRISMISQLHQECYIIVHIFPRLPCFTFLISHTKAQPPLQQLATWIQPNQKKKNPQPSIKFHSSSLYSLVPFFCLLGSSFLTKTTVTNTTRKPLIWPFESIEIKNTPKQDKFKPS